MLHQSFIWVDVMGLLRKPWKFTCGFNGNRINLGLLWHEQLGFTPGFIWHTSKFSTHKAGVEFSEHSVIVTLNRLNLLIWVLLIYTPF